MPPPTSGNWTRRTSRYAHWLGGDLCCAPDRWAAASPADHAQHIRTPTLLIYSAKGGLAAQAQAWHTALTAAGVTHKLITIDTATVAKHADSPGRREPQAPPAPGILAATVAELPELDGAQIAIAGLHHGERGTILHLLARGVTLPAPPGSMLPPPGDRPRPAPGSAWC